MSRSGIINAPAEIWLVYGDIDGEGEVRHEECVEVCWHNEQMWPHDVRYVRADIAETERQSLRAELAAARASALGDAP